MITINLLPVELRTVKKVATARPYIPLAVLFVALFLLLTLFFYTDFMSARSSYKGVYKEWQKISPQMQVLKQLEAKVDIELRGKKEFLEKYILNTDSMTNVLQWASEYLPRRGWLTEVKLERDGDGGKLVLKGVVFAMSDKTGIEQIEEYMGKLKEKLPEGSFTLTTAKQDDKEGPGTSFAATFTWGADEA